MFDENKKETDIFSRKRVHVLSKKKKIGGGGKFYYSERERITLFLLLNSFSERAIVEAARQFQP